MRRIQLLLLTLLSCFAVTGQTITAISPTGDGGFESGTTFAANGWNVVTGAGVNQWYLGSTPGTFAGSRCAYISNNGGTTWAYTNSSTTATHLYRDITVPAGATNLTLSLYRKNNGESSWDQVLAYYGPTTAVPPNNQPSGTATTMTGFTNLFMSTTGGTAPPWTLHSFVLPNTLAGTTFRIVLSWKNDASFGTNPPGAFDNVSFTYTAPPPTITSSTTSLTFGGTTVGSSSPAQVYTVSGSFLSPTSGNLTVTAPAGYEISSNGITWVTSYSIPYSSATVPATPVYVRFSPSAATPYSGNVSVSGGGATTSNVIVSGTGASACSGTPTAGSASIVPGSGLATTPFTLSLGGYTVAGGLSYQWQSGPSATGPWTNITGATNINYSFTGITANTYYRCNVTCGASTSSSAVAMATFVPLPGCLPTSASWVSAANVSFGINTFNITGFSGSNLTDAGMTAASSTATGYLSRLAMTPVNLQQGGTYPASTTRSSTTSYQYQTVWIDFNNNGLFENSEMVTPVAGSFPLTSAIASPFNFNITIPLTAPAGMHLMRIRGIWESTATTIGSVPTLVHPCNLNNGSNPSYFSGNVIDYYVNIVPMPPTLYRTPTSLSFAATTAGTNSTPLTFSTNGIMLAAPPDNITVTAPANFEVSPDGTTWSSSFTIPYTTSMLPATTVHVRFNAPVTTGTYTGNVVISGGGATPVNVAVSAVSSAPCSGTPTAGTAAVSPSSASGTDVISLSLSGFTVSGGITFQWQSGPSSTGPWTNITGATNITHSFSGLSANTFYRCNVSCGSNTAPSTNVMVTFLPVPACIPTAASWVSVVNKTFGINTFNITGFSGSNLNDFNMTTPTSSSTGYLSRLALAPINLQQGGVYPANTTRSSTTSRQYQCVWIDFNNNGLFEDAEAVTPVGGSSPLTSVIASPFNFNITIPLTAAPGLHLMRIRGVWESSATTIGVVPSIIHPCNINNGGNPSYFSGNVVDYYVNIVPMPPTLYRAPTSLSFAATTAGSPSTPLTFTTNGLNLTSPPGNVTVTAPTDFQVSADGISWFSSINLPYSTSTLPLTTVYVRFMAPVTTGSYSGNVVISGGGATPINVAVDCISAAPCSGAPTPGTAALSPSSGSGLTTFSLSLSGYTIAGGIGFQWQSGPTGTGPWTNIAGATNASHTFSGLTTSTYYRCNVSCGATAVGSNTVMATFMQVPSCTPTAASWTSVANVTFGINTFNVTGFSGSTLADAGMTAATNTGTGYLSRLAMTPLVLQEGGIYPANTTRSSISSYEYQTVWIDFNDNGTFENAEMVTPVAGSSPLTATIVNPFNFNITIPFGANPGLHLMRIRGIWESTATTIGVVPPLVHPCNINNGSNPSYFSGNVVDYYVNIVPLPPCAGVPTTGTVNATASSNCTTFNSNLSLSAGATGQTYQWQVSADDVAWTDLAGATNPTYTATVSATSYYRCVVTCTSSGLSANSPSRLLSILPCIIMPASTSASATVCGGLFYDNAGPSGTYACCSITGTQTFYPGTPGKKVQLVFNYLTVETCCDYMRFYNGSSTAAPQIGGNYNSNPGTITSTAADGSLTVTFYSDVSVVAAGWEATINLVGTASNPITTQPAAVTHACQTGTVNPLATVATGSTFTYQWYNNGTTNSNVGGTLIAGATNATYAPSTAAVGTTYYYCIVRDVCGVFTSSNPGAVIVGTPTPAITGTADVCEGRTTDLANVVTAGTWSSSNTAVATVTGALGAATVTGVVAGNATISYFTSPACFATRAVTVNATPVPITGPSFQVCEAATTPLTHPDGGTGTWLSVSPSVATIDATTGVLTGVVNGYATISYTNTNGCVITREITVNPLPTVTVSPATSTICLGESSTFTATSAAPQLSLLSQDFNTSLGGWSVTNGTGSSDSWWQIVSGPGAASFGGDGTPYLQAAATAFTSGTTVSTITSPSFSTMGGFGTVNLSFNQYLFSFAPDAAASIEYSVDGGGTWTEIENQALAVITDNGDDGDWSAAQPEYTVAMPAAALSQPDVRIRFVYNASSLYWLLDNISVKGVMPASTFAWSGAAGLSCSACATAVITPTVSGTNSYTVATTTSAGCVTNTPVDVIVNPLPAPISGSLTVCENLTGTLTSTAGGEWTSSSTANATVDMTTGMISGVAAGTSAITYTFPTTGCIATAVATVLPAPAAITPAAPGICIGDNGTLSTTATGGVWTSGNAAVATIDASGVVSSVSVGNADITYTIPTGCITVRNVTINPLPAAITGASAVCAGATTTLANADPMGTWSGSDASVATINPTTGDVTGVAAGNMFVTYTLPTGCYAVRNMQVDAAPLATTGATDVCSGLTAVVSNPSTGGLWTSSAPATASIDASGIITGGTAGTATISYTFASTGCSSLYTFTVNPLPAPITGVQKVCRDASITFANADAFGSWTSADATIASIDGTTGEILGVAPGNTRITYTLPTGCIATRTVTVNPRPNDISGANTVCYGSTTTMINTTPLGTWSSSDASMATINAAGTVSPVASAGGAVTISYVLTATGCYKTHDIIINPLPSVIAGSTTLCLGNSVTLTNADAGGTWTSGNTGVFVINSVGFGVGVGQGTALVSYTLPTGCRRTTNIVVNPLPSDIYGSTDVCEGSQIELGNMTPGGNWSVADPSIATISGSGFVTGIMAGYTTVSYTLGTGCYRVADINVNPLPGAITGDFEICAGTNSLLYTADAGGTWVSSHPSIATVSVAGNVVAGMSAGGAIISYIMPNGCFRTQVMTIDPLPATITGTASVCEGLTTDLNNTTPDGIWTSDDVDVATVDAVSGLVSGVQAGSVRISYTLPTGCFRTRNVVVNATPSAIGGVTTSCPGESRVLTNTVPGGVWSSSTAAVASITSAGVVNANTAGATNITYTLPAGCRTMTSFVVNPLPAAITGTRVLCNGATTTLANTSAGGNWSTSNPAIADIDAMTGEVTGNGAGVTSVMYTLPTGCSRSANVTVNALPAAITGSMAVCEGSTTQLATTSNGGTWSSDNTAVATVSNSGLVSGVAAGGANIMYTLPTGCRTTTAVVVNALPDNITGATSVCLGQQATVLNATMGGTWTSSNTGIADVDGTGAVTGMGAGTAVLRYTITATGCSRTKSFVVNPLPAAITGTMSVCQGSTTTLGNASTGGSWSSSNSSVASVSAGGNVSGLTVGFSIITYTLPTGCSVSNTMVVNALPEPITGTAVMCAGGNTTLESATMGGTWSSSNSNASITSAGVVTGLASGTSIITYMTGNGCRRVRTVTVNALPGLITGAGSVCPGQTLTLGNSMSGGTWSSDNTSVATVDVNGVVTPATATGGTAFIAYTLPTGCVRSRQITVHPAVEAITGTGTICRTGTTMLSNATAGGVWTSSNTAIASVDGAGMVSGAGAGAATIAYTIPATGCKSEMTVVVNPLPGNISGAAAVCAGSTVVLSNTVPGGSWASSDAAVATISSGGMVTGVAAGSAMITYTLPTGCNVIRSIVVNALPEVKNVTGGGSYCAGGAGVAVGVDGSEAGTIYKLMNGGTTPVMTMMGSGTGTVDFGLQTGAGSYMVTAVSAAGCMRDMNGNAIVAVTPLVTPEVSLSSDKGTSVCAGTAVVYSATAVNGGTAPVYEWRVNGALAGTGASYSYSPADGDVVRVQMTSNATCPSVSSVNTELTMTVRANLTPAVVVTATPGNNICAGTSVSFSAAGANGGSAPVYTWVVNGAPVAGATNTMYSYQPANGDVVLCRLTSSYGCVTTNDVASNSTTMAVAPVFVPEVEVVANPGTIVPEGTEVTFTTVVNNAGATPTYQWMINAIPVSGATQPVFKTANLRNGDSVTCRVTGTGACSKTTINSVNMTITPATGVGHVNLSGSDLRLYPNPNSGVFEVRGTVGVKTDVEAQLEVTNVLGQVVYRGAARTKGGELEARIELGGNMANGMYLLNVTVGESRQSFHFVVKQ